MILYQIQSREASFQAFEKCRPNVKQKGVAERIVEEIKKLQQSGYTEYRIVEVSDSPRN